MVICHCEVISDWIISSLAAEGCTTVESVTALCGAGADCGGCHDMIEDLLEASVTPVTLAVAGL